METPIRNLNTLKALKNANLIKFCEQTGTKICGLYSSKLFTCYYIDDAIGSSRFTFNGKNYIVKYVDGCFFPYVFLVN